MVGFPRFLNLGEEIQLVECPNQWVEASSVQELLAAAEELRQRTMTTIEPILE
jgi:hypothetical protein